MMERGEGKFPADGPLSNSPPQTVERTLEAMTQGGRGDLLNSRPLHMEAGFAP